MNNYYQETLVKIKKLINAEELDKAFHILETEINMPYIPKEHEKEFNQLYIDLSITLKGNQSVKTYSNEQIMEMIFSDDSQKQIKALKSLPQLNLRPFADDLKKRFDTWEDKQMKIVLFETLHEQQIDIELDFEGVKINPKDISVFDHENIFKTSKILEELSEKAPQLMGISMGVLSDYVMNIFPIRITDPKASANDIIAVSEHLLDGNKSLTDNQIKIKNILS